MKILKITFILTVAIFKSISTSVESTTKKEEPPKTEQHQPKINANLSIKDSPINKLIYCQDKKNIISYTIKGTVYLSVNNGESWNSLRPSMQQFVEFLNKGIKKKNKKVIFEGISNIVQHKVNKNTLIFIGTGNISFKTKDCGKTVTYFQHKKGIHKVSMHPTEADKVLFLIVKKRTCLTPLCLPNRNLYLSTNFLLEFKRVDKNILDFSWAYDPETADKDFPKNRIILLRQTEGGEVKGQRWSEKYSILHTDNLYKRKPKVLMEQGNRFALSKHFLFLAKVISEESQQVQLYVSRSGTKKYDFRKVLLPYPLLKQHSYTILDYTSRQVFIHVTHSTSNIVYGNIYKSDSTGSTFTLSVDNNVRNIYGYCDFTKAKGLGGIYFTNKYDETDLEKARIQLENAETQEEKNQAVLNNMKKKTRISYDRGGIWHKIKPAPNADQKCFENPDCSLHLNSLSSFAVGPIYSTENAPGLIISTGNHGEFLDEEKADTYLSNNGGLTWQKVANGSHIYQIGDQGGLIVMARDDKAVDSILFTWNHGVSWREMIISEKPVFVTNIVTEPSHKGLIFQIYGVPEGETYGFVIKMSFEELMPRNCVHRQTGDTDYETWTPHSPDNRCFNGEKLIYLRRKPESECFNPDELEMVKRERICPCSKEDWECDIGYFRDSETGICTRLDGYSGPDHSEIKNCEGNEYYLVKSGYRKVAGNVCEGGVDLGPHHMKCPHNHELEMIYLGAMILFFVLCSIYCRKSSQVKKDGNDMNDEEEDNFLLGEQFGRSNRKDKNV